MASPALLELQQVRAAYGHVRVLHDVSLSIYPGELVALLGANGAGKSTLLRCVSRLLPVQGELSVDGRSIAARSTEEVAQMGVAHVPEGRGTFTELTVLENLLLGARARRKTLRPEMSADLDAVYGYFPILREFRERPA